jgi:predicted regulator of amino acid metabolism with ACT domain
MRAFIVMPFAPELKDVYEAIKRACKMANVDPVRADEILEPGPIINQIFDQIAQADVIIAEITSKNPNVYYEIALAHCRQIPTILLADESALKQLPFDIRHNRVLVYKKIETEKIDYPLVQ